MFLLVFTNKELLTYRKQQVEEDKKPLETAIKFSHCRVYQVHTSALRKRTLPVRAARECVSFPGSRCCRQY